MLSVYPPNPSNPKNAGRAKSGYRSSKALALVRARVIVLILSSGLLERRIGLSPDTFLPVHPALAGPSGSSAFRARNGLWGWLR